ncbi:ribonuclease HII [Candidatus Bathyarchaeota archaeon]|nr:ribonuclease HII [Candidatus Bathyarchaeota archaeon]
MGEHLLICGIDDAGRGPIIGPLVIAGIVVDEHGLSNLINIGVKDSKILSPRRREHLAAEILKIAENYRIIKVPPSEIDHVVKTGKKLNRLNRLEARVMANIIRELRPDIAYVDASDILPERFRQHIAEEIPFKVEIVSEHKADRKYPVVSAASIIAKVERDREIAELKKKYGDFGSGYVADPKTMRFLRRWIENHDSYPDFVRKSWKTIKALMKNKDSGRQRSLSMGGCKG